MPPAARTSALPWGCFLPKAPDSAGTSPRAHATARTSLKAPDSALHAPPGSGWALDSAPPSPTVRVRGRLPPSAPGQTAPSLPPECGWARSSSVRSDPRGARRRVSGRPAPAPAPLRHVGSRDRPPADGRRPGLRAPRLAYAPATRPPTTGAPSPPGALPSARDRTAEPRGSPHAWESPAEASGSRPASPQDAPHHSLAIRPWQAPPRAPQRRWSPGDESRSARSCRARSPCIPSHRARTATAARRSRRAFRPLRTPCGRGHRSSRRTAGRPSTRPRTRSSTRPRGRTTNRGPTARRRGLANRRSSCSGRGSTAAP